MPARGGRRGRGPRHGGADQGRRRRRLGQEWTATADAVEAAGGQPPGRATRQCASPTSAARATYHATALYLIDASHENEGKLARWRRQRACWEQVVDLIGAASESRSRTTDTTMPAILLPRAGRGAGRAAAAGRAQQRQRRRGVADVGPGRRGGERARLPLDDVRRSGPAGACCSSTASRSGRTGRPSSRRCSTRWWPATTSTPIGSRSSESARPASGSRARSRSSIASPRPSPTRRGGRLDLVDRAAAEEHAQGPRGRQAGAVRSRYAARRAVLPLHRSAAPRSAASPTAWTTTRRYRLYQTVMGYRLGDEVAQIDTPLLITDPEGEQFWPGQSQQLFDRLPGPKQLVRFTAAEGASRHCEPMAVGAPRRAHLRLARRVPRPLELSRRSNAPDRIRTCDLRFRRPTLYPAELRALAVRG